jgi:predicted DNA binding CopG/RHH family protein
MSKADKYDDVVSRDWSATWEELPTVSLPRSRSAEPAQITLRVAGVALAALKRLAASKTVAYHSLARSWIVEALARGSAPSLAAELSDIDLGADSQINIKLDGELLLSLKRFAHERRIPYHRIGRLWIYDGLARERAWSPMASPSLSISDLMLLLLHARGPKGSQDESIRGLTRLVKLLFVASQRLGSGTRDLFYAYNYGPFADAVHDAEGALSAEGLLAGEADPGTIQLPSFEQMNATVMKKGAKQTSVPLFQLSEKGRRIAKKLEDEDPRLKMVMAVIERVKREYGGLSEEELLERVYAEYPASAEKSVRLEVRERAAARRRNKSE